MLQALRAYLYCTVLVGFLTLPGVGLRAIVPALLTAADLLLISICAVYIGHGWSGLKHSEGLQPLRRALIMLAVTVVYGLAVTAGSAGALVEAAKYLGALCRAPLILMAIYVHAHTGVRPTPAQVYRTLRHDFALLSGIQMSVAALQLIWPSVGIHFIGDYAEGQSARAALEEGDVSGTFANSIDMAYFLMAAYVTLTLAMWQRGRAPALWMTALFGFFVYATGSVAASVCMGLYAGYLHVRPWPLNIRRFVPTAVAVLGLGALYLHFDALATAVIDKVDNMMLSRLGLLFVSLPALVESQPLRLLTGFGLDFEVILGVLRDLPEVPLVFLYDESAVVINDVFWAALVLGLGAPLVALALTRLAHLFAAFLGADSRHPEQRSLWGVFVLVLLLAGLLNQILLVRPFVAGLLLGLAPLALSHAMRSRSRTARSST